MIRKIITGFVEKEMYLFIFFETFVKQKIFYCLFNQVYRIFRWLLYLFNFYVETEISVPHC